jgi:predicted DNA-binding WGR domain protein
MRKLQLEYQIEKISRLFEEGSILWDNAEFTFYKDFTAHLKIYEIDIEPEKIMQTWGKLEERGQSCQVAMKCLGERSIIFKKNKSGYPLRSS